MATATRPDQQTVTTVTKLHATSEQVWHEIERASFAVVGYVTPSGEARSSGVVYKAVGKRLYVAVAPESWKARHIAASKRVSVTVPVHRGGVLALVAPIPPATISFHAAAIVHPAGSVSIDSLSKELESLLPAERLDNAVLIELIPEGRFLTYGVGVSLTDMQKPEIAEAVVPVTD
jgi:pyridoxamine 5'-phosphate oxidase-like protein